MGQQVVATANKTFHQIKHAKFNSGALNCCTQLCNV